MQTLYRKPNSLEWFVDVETGDGRVSHGLGTANRALAERRAAQLLGPRADTSVSAPAVAAALVPGSVHWALALHLRVHRDDLADETIRMYRHQAGHLVRILGGVELGALERAHIERFRAVRLAEGAGKETARKGLVLLRAAVRTARAHGMATRPIEQVFPKLRSAYEPRRRWLEPEEYDRLLDELREDRKLWLACAVYTGARLGELQRLGWEDIDWARGHMAIRGTKPRLRIRFVPLHPALRAVLEPVRAEAGKVLEPWAKLHRDLRAACKRAGVRPVSPNDLRRTFASWLLQQGASSFTVARLLGHTSETMINRVYGHLSDQALRTAVDLLPQK